MKTPFYGRETELKRLNDLLKKKTSSLVVIQGRRRIGKSRLIEEFSKNHHTFYFTGLPPEKDTTAQQQRDFFVNQMSSFISANEINAGDWMTIFRQLAQHTNDGRIIVVFDEINWMGTLDSAFLGKLKSAWDLYFSRNPQLILILSGSMSAWIDAKILRSTGFMGRVSLELTLKELSLPVCNLFWGKQAPLVSSYEKFKILSITGGVPRYLQEIDPYVSAEENIYRMAFTPGGILVEEFDRIFSDLFLKRSPRYKEIVERLVDGSTSLQQIRISLGIEKGGTLSEYIKDLVETGYIARDYHWDIKTRVKSKISKYRLKDNYLRFYLKYIEPKRENIEKGHLKTPPAWLTIMGIQFENLVANNFHALYAALHINPQEIVFDSPYFQRPTENDPGCQIDYLIQTEFNTLYVCEVKFSKGEIGRTVIPEVKEKIRRLSRGRNFSIRPVLIHVNGVNEEVIEAGFFAHIIDFGQLLNATI